jgi:plasmid stabilization system protein ParE
MEVVYLATALEDMQWVRRYYAEVFPEGHGHARASLLKTAALIAENPFVGHALVDDVDILEFPVARTPFSFLYRVHDGRIEILRVFDQRSFRFGSGLI